MRDIKDVMRRLHVTVVLKRKVRNSIALFEEIKMFPRPQIQEVR